MQCIICKIYFLKVFHKYYNFIYTPICTKKIFILAKSGCYNKVLIDCAKKSVKLTTPDRKELEFIAEPVVTAKGIANRAKLNQLDASQG
jgi:hypothetical protein